MHTLIIEDDYLFIEVLEHFLDDNDCETTVATTLAEAEEKLKAFHFDFVLLDNILPDGAGIDFIETIREVSVSPLPVVMITASDNQSLMADAFKRGADDFLLKPFSLELLLQKMQRVCELYQKEAELERQTHHLEKLINQREQEEALARYVYESVASCQVNEERGIETYLQSSSAFNGDAFISETSPNGNKIVLLADATGHGLAAAISILPLMATIRAMIRKGFPLAHIVHEANSKLGKELPDDKFVALAGIELNFHLQEVYIFNGGMPDILAIRQDGNIEHFKSKTMAMGILDPEDFDPAIRICDMGSFQHLVMYSDGIIEQCSPCGEEYGMQRLIASIQENRGSEPILSRVINEFTVFNELQELTDDLSLCDIQLDVLHNKHKTDRQELVCKKTGKLCASISISGELVAATDIIGCFDSLMRCADIVGDLRQRCFTVFAELISNALDHGVLGLDSKLKNDITGFADYLALKEERLANINPDDELLMTFQFDFASHEISFEIKDSGKGYSLVEKSDDESKDKALSGRGLSLINKLCSKVDVEEPGNKTNVVINREY